MPRNVVFYSLEIIGFLMIAAIAYVGLADKRLWFIQSPRMAVIALGAVGMALCALSVGRFVSGAPAHPVTIFAYLVGAVGLFAYLTQIFQWNLPVFQDAKAVIWILLVVLVVKWVISRMDGWVIKP